MHLANVSVESVHLQVTDALWGRWAVEVCTVLPRRTTAHVRNYEMYFKLDLALVLTTQFS
jgi:hypothetical protein